jgi:hypothetical protein
MNNGLRRRLNVMTVAVCQSATTAGLISLGERKRRMIRIVGTVLIIAVVAGRSFGAEKGPWLIDVDANVTLAQNAYSESWIGSERGAVSWASKLLFVAEKQVTSRFNHRNTLKLEFGQTKTQRDNRSWEEMAKSTDLIDFESLQRFSVNGMYKPFMALRCISQFLDETDSTDSHYGNPLDVFESFGLSRALVANDLTTWDARFGGAVHQAVNRYYRGGTSGGSSVKTVNDAGLSLVTELKASWRDGLLDYNGQLTVFEALVSSEEDSENSGGTPFWRYPDINWENILSINLSKYIMLNFNAQLLFDREKHPNARIKEVLAIGLTYKFSNKKKAEPAAQ